MPKVYFKTEKVGFTLYVDDWDTARRLKYLIEQMYGERVFICNRNAKPWEY